MRRRELLKLAGGAVAGGLIGAGVRPVSAEEKAPPLLQRICLFTDHLDDYDYSYAEVAGMLKQLGIAGPDLTVRGGGLVLPERAAEDLPRAAAAFKAAGLSIPMISTNLTVGDATARAILGTAGKLGVRHFKLGYYHYHDPAAWRARLEEVRHELIPLLQLAESFGLTGGIHNHAGATVGGAIWDTAELLPALGVKNVGFYFDPSHATIEGGNHAWKLNFHRAAERLKMVALKDFVWEKTGGQWRTRWVPLGEGMVRWPEFFRMLAKTGFSGPVSLHIEYDPGGATKAARFENSFAAAARDLAFVRKHWEAAQKAG